MLSFFFQDLRYTLRQFRGRPGFTAVAVLCLALGIGANAAIFSVVNAVLLRPLPLKEPSRLMVLWEQDIEHGKPLIEVSFANFTDWRAQNHAFEEMTAFGSVNWGYVLRGVGEPYPIEYSAVSTSFFRTLGVEAYLGRTFMDDEDRPDTSRVVVLSHSLWERRFGSDPDVIGRSVTLSAIPFTIVGVMPRDFQFPRGAELWTPVGRDLADFFRKANFSTEDERGFGVLYVIGRLKPRLTPEDVRPEMDAIIRRIGEGQDSRRTSIVMKPFLDHFLGASTRPALLALWGAVALVLLIACANVASLLLVRALGRRREIAIRLALGASRGRILSQLFTESGVLALAGGALGLALAILGLKLLITLTPTHVPRLEETAIDGRALAVTLAISLMSALLAGLAPAWQTSRPAVAVWVRTRVKGASEDPRSHTLRRLIVGGEIATALVLLIGAGLLGASFLNLRRLDLGYQPENVLTLRVNAEDDQYPTIREKRAFHRELLERVRGLPGVTAVGAVYLRPLEHDQIGVDAGLLVEGQPLGRETMDKNPWVNWEAVTPDYFRAMSIPLREGRFFTEQDTEDMPGVVIVGESLARRLWPGESALGKRLWTWGGKWDLKRNVPTWLTVVGVVADGRYREIPTPRMDLYLSYLQAPNPVKHLVVRTGSHPLSLVSAIRNEVRALDKHQPVDGITTLTALVSRAMAPWRFNAFLFGVFAALALFLAAVGLFGLIAFSVTERTQEIGVRMALGAQSADVVKLMVGQGMAPALAGLGIGLVASLALTRLLSSLLFGVNANDPSTYALVSFFLLGVTLLASYLPARRATRVDPLSALRSE